ncbi:MAG: murein L,D-transpeptidase family protein [Stappiaceae bacterium]
MTNISRLLIILTCLVAVYLASPLVKAGQHFLARSTANIEEVRQRVEPGLREDLQSAGFQLGEAAFIRIFNEENELEIWLRTSDEFKLFKTYDICNYSGALGPKLKEGDRQSPEGFYGVDKAAMNPNSSYHLSFNLGFPNLFDQANQRTGSFLMVHGNCVSIGCYAMTDQGIEEIYLIVEAAQETGQKMVPVHAFPFRMTRYRLALEQDNRWFEYWQNLKQGFDLFEKERVPPVVSVSDKKYVFSSGIGI